MYSLPLALPRVMYRYLASVSVDASSPNGTMFHSHRTQATFHATSSDFRCSELKLPVRRQSAVRILKARGRISNAARRTIGPQLTYPEPVTRKGKQPPEANKANLSQSHFRTFSLPSLKVK